MGLYFGIYNTNEETNSMCYIYVQYVLTSAYLTFSINLLNDERNIKHL